MGCCLLVIYADLNKLGFLSIFRNPISLSLCKYKITSMPITIRSKYDEEYKFIKICLHVARKHYFTL